MECRLNIESCAQRFEALRDDNNGKADEGEKKKGYDWWEKECWPDLIYNRIVNVGPLLLSQIFCQGDKNVNSASVSVFMRACCRL